MGEFDQILDCDQENVLISKKNLLAVSPKALELLDSCTVALKHLSDEYARLCDFDRQQDRLESAVKAIPDYSPEVLRHIYDSILIGPVSEQDPIATARDAIAEEVAVQARVLLGLRLRRDLVLSLADLLRLRVSTSLGVLRTQAETTALIRLIALDKYLGRRWFDTVDDTKGRQFYKDNQRSIKACISDLGMLQDYERGSNMALHPRASGIAYGYILGGTTRDNAGAINLVYQETLSAEGLLFWFCMHLRFYKIVVERAQFIYPELGDDFQQHDEIVSYQELHTSVIDGARQVIDRAKQEGRWRHGA